MSVRSRERLDDGGGGKRSLVGSNTSTAVACKLRLPPRECQRFRPQEPPVGPLEAAVVPGFEVGRLQGPERRRRRRRQRTLECDSDSEEDQPPTSGGRQRGFRVRGDARGGEDRHGLSRTRRCRQWRRGRGRQDRRIPVSHRSQVRRHVLSITGIAQTYRLGR